VAVETMTELPNLTPAIPEILLAAAALTLLLYGAFRGDSSTRTVSWATVLVMGVAAVFIVSGPSDGVHTFAGMFVADGFGVFMKLLILLGSALTIILSLGYIRDHGMERFEYPILILLATLGMMMMVAAADLISLYVGLELQSLSLYVLAAFRRDSERSTEAGLKYFVLGALASGILLYGASLVYGFTGSTNFEAIAANIAAQENGASVGVLFGLAFLTAGLAFKVAAVPFHMWTPDVYEGAPTPVTAFFSVAPKIAAFALLVRVMMGRSVAWRQIGARSSSFYPRRRWSWGHLPPSASATSNA
jgi:NADH-quinone oxidoreductase subunit N